MCVGIIQHTGDLNRTKREGKANSLLPLELRYLNSDQDLDHFSYSDPITPTPQALRLKMNYTAGFSLSLACRWHIVGLPSLHSHVSLYMYLHLIGSVSLENSSTAHNAGRQSPINCPPEHLWESSLSISHVFMSKASQLPGAYQSTSITSPFFVPLCVVFEIR